MHRLSVIATALCCLHVATADGSVVGSWRRWVRPELAEVEATLGSLAAERARLPVTEGAPDFSAPGWRSRAAAVADTEKWLQVDLGRVLPVDDIVLMPAVLPSPAGTPVPVGFPLRFRVDVASAADFAEVDRVQDCTQADVADPGPMPFVIRRVGKSARFVRVTAERLRGEPDNYFFALGELVVCSGNRNVAEGARVTASDVFDSPRWSLQGAVDGRSVAGRPVEDRSLPTNGYHGREETAPDVEQWVQVDLGAECAIDEVRLVAARPVDFPDTIGFGFPPRFRVEASAEADFSAPVTVADHTREDFPNPGDRHVSLLATGVHGRFVRVTATRLWPRHRQQDDYVFALAELEVLSRGTNVALDRPVVDSARLEGPSSRWKPAYLVDGIAPRDGVGTYAEWLAARARLGAIDAEMASLRPRAEALREEADVRLAAGAGGVAVLALLAAAVAVLTARSRQRRQALELRTGIARDLHDDIGSNLSAIGLMSDLALQAAPDATAMRGELEEIRRVASETADSMHDIVWLISPGTKTAGDLSARLRETAGRLLGGLQWEMAVDGLDAAERLPLGTQRDLFLVFKEALHNVRRHAGATRVDVSFRRTDEGLELRVADDGRGFVPAKELGRGNGLVNMHRRAESCRGRLEIDSAPGHGTVLTLTLP